MFPMYLTDVVLYYCTVADIRSEGVPSSSSGGPTDAAIQRRIKRCSRRISNITKQWFQPVRRTIKVDGNNSPYIHHPYLIPIIDVFSVSWISTFDERLPIDSEIWRIDGRHLAKTTAHIISGVKKHEYGYADKVWKRGIQNYEIEGVFGWIDLKSRKQTELSADISVGQTIVELGSTNGLLAGDSILIGSQHFFINEVLGPTEIGIDPSYSQINAPVDVFRYGRIPEDLVYATILLVLDKPFVGRASEEYEEFDGFARIRSEKTDNYSYTLDRSQKASEEDSYSRGGTGNLEVDSILSRYCAPNYVTFV